MQELGLLGLDLDTPDSLSTTLLTYTSAGQADIASHVRTQPTCQMNAE